MKGVMKKMTDKKMEQLLGLLLDIGSDTLDSGVNTCVLKVHTDFGILKFRIKFEEIEEEHE